MIDYVVANGTGVERIRIMELKARIDYRSCSHRARYRREEGGD